MTILRIEQYIGHRWVHVIDLPADEFTPEELLSSVHTTINQLSRGVTTIYNDEAMIAAVVNIANGPTRVEVVHPAQLPGGNFTYDPIPRPAA